MSVHPYNSILILNLCFQIFLCILQSNLAIRKHGNQLNQIKLGDAEKNCTLQIELRVAFVWLLRESRLTVYCAVDSSCGLV